MDANCKQLSWKLARMVGPNHMVYTCSLAALVMARSAIYRV
jgi:hypothetical protein